MRNARFFINRLGLKPHPEGGYFREIYRSGYKMDHPVHGQKRNLATSIYFLLEGSNISHFHELASDELWYFHEGKGAIIHIFNDGKYQEHELNISNTGLPQVLIPAGSQFAAEVIDQEGFVLMGCMVNPGFDFGDFKMMNKKEMLEKHPGHKELIEKFCVD